MSTTTPAEALVDDLDDIEAQAALDAEADRLRRQADLRFGGDRQEQLLNRCRLVSEACGEDPFTGAPRYEPTEVLSWFARAVEMGCEMPQIGPRQVERLFRLTLVPNARLRERFEELRERGETSSNRVALALGLTKKGGGGDPSYVERMLGISSTPDEDPNGEPVQRMRLFVTYDQAAALADALDLPYQTVGV